MLHPSQHHQATSRDGGEWVGVWGWGKLERIVGESYISPIFLCFPTLLDICLSLFVLLGGSLCCGIEFFLLSRKSLSLGLFNFPLSLGKLSICVTESVCNRERERDRRGCQESSGWERWVGKFVERSGICTQCG